MKKIMGEEMEMEDEMEADISEDMDDHEVQEAADCLLRAEEIKKDKKLFASAMEKLNGKKSAIESIADLRKKAFGNDDEESSPESKKKDK